MSSVLFSRSATPVVPVTRHSSKDKAMPTAPATLPHSATESPLVPAMTAIAKELREWRGTDAQSGIESSWQRLPATELARLERLEKIVHHALHPTSHHAPSPRAQTREAVYDQVVTRCRAAITIVRIPGACVGILEESDMAVVFRTKDYDSRGNLMGPYVPLGSGLTHFYSLGYTASQEPEQRAQAAALDERVLVALDALPVHRANGEEDPYHQKRFLANIPPKDGLPGRQIPVACHYHASEGTYSFITMNSGHRCWRKGLSRHTVAELMIYNTLEAIPPHTSSLRYPGSE